MVDGKWGTEQGIIGWARHIVPSLKPKTFPRSSLLISLWVKIQFHKWMFSDYYYIALWVLPSIAVRECSTYLLCAMKKHVVRQERKWRVSFVYHTMWCVHFPSAKWKDVCTMGEKKIKSGKIFFHKHYNYSALHDEPQITYSKHNTIMIWNLPLLATDF